MSYGELTSRFREAERNGGEHLTGYIVFTEDSFTKPYPEAARTYAVSSNNKAFQPNMGGYSIYASALDGSDPMIRLEGYMQSEKGGKDGWKIERCYMKNDEKEMIDVIFGPFFICDCSGPNYGSLNQEQIDRFMKQFENPERLIRMNGTLMSAIPLSSGLTAAMAISRPQTAAFRQVWQHTTPSRSSRITCWCMGIASI